MSRRRVHVIVRGRVQGVYFRDYTRRQAQVLGVSGWVCNRPDRTVEAVIEGEAGPVAAMLDWLHIGSPLATVTGVEAADEAPCGEQGFVIRR